MPNYLVFRLHSSMASWGDTAVGGVRPSHRYPTKSAVLGLVAAALGIRREEETRLLTLQDEVGFATRVDNEGVLLIDYHTTQVPSRANLKNNPHSTRRDELLIPELNTILSTREYYCDALYTIVLWQQDNATSFSLIDIKKALLQPVFVLYLGRKSCPLSFPVYPASISAENIEQALTLADEELAVKEGNFLSYLQANKNPKHFYWESQDKVDNAEHYKDRRTRKDKLRNRQRWQYQEREEYYKMIPDEENNSVF